MRIAGRTGDMMLDGDATTGAGTRSGSKLDPARMTAKERAALRKKVAAETKAKATRVEQAAVAADVAIVEATTPYDTTAATEAAKAAQEAEAALKQAEFEARLAKEGEENARTRAELDAALRAQAAAEAAIKAAQAAADEAKAKAEAELKAQQEVADKAAKEAAAAAKAAQEAAAKAAAEAEAKATAAKAAAEKAAADAAKATAAAKAAAEKAASDAKAVSEKAAADAKAAADKAAADKTAADKVAADAKAAAEAALKAAREAQAKAEAEAAAAKAATDAIKASANINVAGNVITPVPGPLDTAITKATAADKAAAEYAKEQAKIAEEQKRLAVSQTLTDRFTKYNLTGLIPTIKRLAQEGATESTITFALQETDDYKTRFKANEDRIKKGLSVLSPAEYLNIEDGYRQILRSYGLSQFDNDEYVSQFISNDMSPAELSNRVVTAVQRVRNADPAISKTLKDYYGIGNDDLVAYVLDPNQQLQKIERQVAAAEIGTAARVQGLEAGVSVAEQLAAQGVTQAQAQRGYSTIADILPTAEKLSDIYGGVEDTYRQAEAEQEVFNQLASAQRKRQRLTQREIAQFSGQSGLGRTSLDRESRGQF